MLVIAKESGNYNLQPNVVFKLRKGEVKLLTKKLDEGCACKVI
jgi:hypothetical protein